MVHEYLIVECVDLSFVRTVLVCGVVLLVTIDSTLSSRRAMQPCTPSRRRCGATTAAAVDEFKMLEMCGLMARDGSNHCDPTTGKCC